MSAIARHPAWPSARSVAGGLLGSGALALAGYQRGALSRGGVVGAIAVGTAIFASGGVAPSILLVTFFVSSSALSHWRRERKRAVAVDAAKGERRDLGQVLANGGVASALVLLGRCWPASRWFAGLLGAVATVNADTWATEIGTLSRRPPRLITTLRPVPTGTSGGVSPVGTLAAVAGAGVIGLVAALTYPRSRLSPSLASLSHVWKREGAGESVRATGARLVALALLGGVAGTLADSLLGATVQARYVCPVCDLPTERTRHRCGTATRLVSGYRWLDNDLVNFLSSSIGAAVAWASA